MGQIFDRLYRIGKSQSVKDEQSAFFEIDNDDEELRRTIDNLNKDKSNYSDKESFHHKENHQLSLFQAYKILEISSNSTIEEIKSAYKKKMMEYHPDRVSNLGQELKNLATKKSKEINESFNLIKQSKGF
jgi:DnaJ like chaperone protein